MQERNFILTDVMNTGFNQDVQEFILSSSLETQHIDCDSNYYNLHLYNLKEYTRRIALIDCRFINKSLTDNLEFMQEFERRIEQLKMRGFVFVQSSSWESVKNNSEEYYPKLNSIEHIKWFGEDNWFWWFMFQKHRNNTFKFEHRCKNFDFLFLMKRKRKSRIDLYNALQKNNLLDHNSLYTFHGLSRSLKLPAEYELPFLTDRNNYPQAGLDQDMYDKPYNESVCSIVSESNIGEVNFITEKTWKPIIAQQLFLIHGPDGILKQLRAVGFQTFDSIFDESYDEEKDPDKKISMIVDVCKFIKSSDWKILYEKSESIRTHNYQHFFNKDALAKTINRTILSWFKFFDSSQISS